MKRDEMMALLTQIELLNKSESRTSKATISLVAYGCVAYKADGGDAAAYRTTRDALNGIKSEGTRKAIMAAVKGWYPKVVASIAPEARIADRVAAVMSHFKRVNGDAMTFNDIRAAVRKPAKVRAKVPEGNANGADGSKMTPNPIQPDQLAGLVATLQNNIRQVPPDMLETLQQVISAEVNRRLTDAEANPIKVA